MNIHIHIERIVVHDDRLAPGEGPLFESALRAELETLLSSRGLTVQPGHMASARSVGTITTGKSPVEFGMQAARAAYGAIHE
jgi:hypothetical protein